MFVPLHPEMVNADVAQLARAADLESAGRGFESLHRLHLKLGFGRAKYWEDTRVAKWGRL